MPDTRKKTGHAEQHDDQAQRESGSSSGGNRNIWIAAIGALVIGAVLVGIFAIGLGNDDSATPATASEGTSTSSGGGEFPIVAYQGADVLGATRLDFTELLGTGTPVVLNFWAGQCPPCRAEMPAFQRVYDTYSDDFLLVGVDIGPYIGLGSRESAIDLLAELGITYPAAGAEDVRAVEDYSVLGMPTTIFYDGDGVEVERVTGILSEDALEANVRELVSA